MCTPSAGARARPRTGARAVTMASTRPDHTVKVRLKIEQCCEKFMHYFNLSILLMLDYFVNVLQNSIL